MKFKVGDELYETKDKSRLVGFNCKIVDITEFGYDIIFSDGSRGIHSSNWIDKNFEKTITLQFNEDLNKLLSE